ncbi:hypothetical protein LTR78_002958 [Recurvomyces mirabilis]|uniref:Uncharacterized protein n=1 Tax=Recurvomyces mirabilis TaxID=574656 RepID=A0AAE0WTE0_9PEZI|nr:hypothetical protein LTR78_002958 [Recurvomyces mirabilis]KAK5159309.1 hypothetical protein LTS14_002451 [Recurvomyces mirabilis]
MNTSAVSSSMASTCQQAGLNDTQIVQTKNDNTITIVFGTSAVVLAAFALIVAMLQLRRTPKPNTVAVEGIVAESV